MSAIAKFQSETDWDVIAGEAPLLARVTSSPATLEELAEVAGEVDLVKVRRRVARLERAGVVVMKADRFEAAARTIESDRQEGMLTSISRYILPYVAGLAHDPSIGFVTQIDLDFDETEQRAFCSAGEQDLRDALDDLSSRPGTGARLHTLVLIGTSDVPSEMPGKDRLLETLKRCGRQRAMSSLADRAVLRTHTALFDDPAAAETLVRSAAAKTATRGEGKLFTVIYAFCANERVNGEGR